MNGMMNAIDRDMTKQERAQLQKIAGGSLIKSLTL